MATIQEIKELEVTGTPVVLFECELAGGGVERWSTHGLVFEGAAYEARVLRHDLFEMRSGAEEGIDAIARVSVTLANADSHCSQIERSVGWKGSRVAVRFVFWDLRSGTAASPAALLFRGIADAPVEITETTLRLAVTNSLNLQRALLPEVRIERRCPWTFPRNAGERAEAVSGGSKGKYSAFYRCGYAPDMPGGGGNFDAGGAPYAACRRTRADCEARGMFDEDAGHLPTRRFGGIEFVPATTMVRSYGEKGQHASAALENEGRYNDFVPLVYGTAWHTPPIVFSKNDGNLTRMEVLLGMGEIEGVLKVLVNNVESPLGETGKDMTSTGWFSVISVGGRTGAFSADYVDGSGRALGDPYGSMAALSVAVPNRVNDGRTLPRVEVLMEGMKLDRFGADGTYLGQEFTSNPAWVLLDILRRSGWRLEEIDAASFGTAAAYCGEAIAAEDLNGNTISIPRFGCNLVLRRRRSAADAIRGVRNGARLYLTYGWGGKLELHVENTLALEQGVKPEGSNAQAPLDGGWPAYEFGDGANGTTGILRRASGEPSVRVWSRGMAETPNRVTLEFQDAFNEYQQDSLSLRDVDDALRTGQEVSVAAPALGVANFSQAARVARWLLDKAVAGNTFVEFETSVRGLGLKPGDVITVTYLKEGFERQPFRIVKVAPGMNYSTAAITAQIHRDEWYDDANGDLLGTGGARRQGRAEMGLPRPLIGKVVDEYGARQFEIEEKSAESADGSARVTLAAGFVAPARPAAGPAIPMLSLAARAETSGGTLAGGQTLYYAVSASDGSGGESGLSFVVRATIPAGGNTNTVTLTGLSFGAQTAAFDVYRGESPSGLLRIAANQALAAEFTDAGLAAEMTPPPDENYDHANFHWRMEMLPECEATAHSANSVGNGGLGMPEDGYRGMVVRLTRGLGAGQERVVVSNTATELTVAGAWETVPDETSWFVVAESSWRFGAAAASSPAEFDVPNRAGATVHVSGQSANAHDRECGYELSPVTRWRIGGAGAGPAAGVPGAPVFTMAAGGRGSIEIGPIKFGSLENTRTISAATLRVDYWNELSSPSLIVVSRAVDAAATEIELSEAGPAQAGDIVQIDAELMRVEEAIDGGLWYRVTRGVNGSATAAHAQFVEVYHLASKTFVIPFARDFFGSPASETFSHAVLLADARVASAEMFATNARGNGAPAVACFTTGPEGGLRTLSGGQYSIQVEGYLAIETGAAPALVVQETHAVRDVSAVVREAPSASPVELRVRVNDSVYALLAIAAGETESNMVSGFGKPALAAGARVELDVLSVGQGIGEGPGRDLTVTVRF